MKKNLNILFYVGFVIFMAPIIIVCLFFILDSGSKSNTEEVVIEKIYDTIPVKKIIKVYDTIPVEKIKWIEKPKVEIDTVN